MTFEPEFVIRSLLSVPLIKELFTVLLILKGTIIFGEDKVAAPTNLISSLSTVTIISLPLLAVVVNPPATLSVELAMKL